MPVPHACEVGVPSLKSLARKRNANWIRASIPSGSLGTTAGRSSTMDRPVVLITGALTGIGRATAIAFAKDGARLVVSGRREAEGKALEAALRRPGAEASFIPADGSREDDVRN